MYMFIWMYLTAIHFDTFCNTQHNTRCKLYVLSRRTNADHNTALSHMSLTWMSHVTYECIMPHINGASHVSTRITSIHIYSRINTYHIYSRINTYHIYSHITYQDVSHVFTYIHVSTRIKYIHVAHINKYHIYSPITYKRAISRINESCLSQP